MSDLLQRMSELVKDFVHEECQVEGVVGIVAFGSFVKGKVRETSDLDLLVLREDIEGHSRTRQKVKEIPLEIYRWSSKLFGKPFLNESVNVFSDAFCFAVMRNGRILYDPKGVLHRFRSYAQTHRLPYSHLKSLAERAYESLHMAQYLLKRRKLEGAEIEIRKAAEELARALLLERDVLEILPPKIYVPHLRKERPRFYRTFCEVHNLEEIQRKEVEVAIQHVSGWWERIVQEIRRKGEEDWKQAEAINGAQTELSNAKDCLENGNLRAAMLQARYSAILLMSPVLRLLQSRSYKAPSMRYMNLLRSRHPYGNVVESVMNFSSNERRIEEHIATLRDIAERYI